jgi:hypothetical protein
MIAFSEKPRPRETQPFGMIDPDFATPISPATLCCLNLSWLLRTALTIPAVQGATMTWPRRVIAGTTYLLNRRCTERQYLLVPRGVSPTGNPDPGKLNPSE